jgi:hypothetical protein
MAQLGKGHTTLAAWPILRVCRTIALLFAAR